jgi:hypothetical protein
MSKTLLAVNTLTAVNNQAYASHLNAAFRMGKDYPEDEFLLFNGYRTGIDRFRNLAGKIALQNDCDYLWFLDDDVLVPQDTYKRMKDWDVDIVTPVTYIRSYPFKPMFFKTIRSSSGEFAGLTHYDNWESDIKAQNQTVREGLKLGLLPVAAIGFSCCLIKTELLRKVPPAWFVTGPDHTEDVYFCIKARQALNNEVGIYVDTNYGVGHQMDPDFVHPLTLDALKVYYETLNPELKNAREGDNSSDYLDRQRAALDKLEYQVHVLEEHNRKVAEGA